MQERTAPEKSAFSVRALGPDEHAAAAALIHRSLVHWYQSRLGQGGRFGASPAPYRIFPDVYAALDPGEAMAAVDQDSGELVGIAFAHSRPSHVAVGIVVVAPEAQSRGVARAMLLPIMECARSSGRPVRLVSSLLNLNSFSLYSRLGFVPHTLYQDMCLNVPAGGLPHPAPRANAGVRRLTAPGDAARMAGLEGELQGLQREKDYAFFLQNRVGDWRVWARENTDGTLAGFLVVSLHPDCVMLGPGVAGDEGTAADLLWTALDAMRGRSPVWLVPCQAQALVRQCYRWGARNVELHVGQATAFPSNGRGIVFPTFLPETG